MNKFLRFTALLLTVVMLIPVSAVLPVNAEIHVDSELADHARAITKVVRDFGASYKFDRGISVSDLHTVMSIVLNDNPDMFHLSAAYQYSYNSNRPDTAIEVMFSYKMTREEYAAASAEVRTWADKVISLADPSFTEYEYALFFHDYIAANYDYDTDYAVRDVYHFLKEGKGVCQAYTYTYAYLLESVGIETTFASSDEMNHIWNVVKIDGKWFHVDVTWDDPIGNAAGVVDHMYFMLSDSAIYNKEKKHYGWVTYHDCVTSRYDNTEVDQSESSYAYLDGKWYFVRSGNLYVTNDPKKKGEECVELDMQWNLWHSNSFYVNNYSGIIEKDGSLYVNSSDKILKIDPKSKSVTDVFKYTAGDGYIYGFTVDMGEDRVSGADLSTDSILISISTEPSKRDKQFLVSLKDGFLVAEPASGDANGDGRTNLSDVSQALKCIAKWDVSISNPAADIDGNGIVNLSDVTAIMKMIAGWAV